MKLKEEYHFLSQFAEKLKVKARDDVLDGQVWKMGVPDEVDSREKWAHREEVKLQVIKDIARGTGTAWTSFDFLENQDPRHSVRWPGIVQVTEELHQMIIEFNELKDAVIYEIDQIKNISSASRNTVLNEIRMGLPARTNILYVRRKVPILESERDWELISINWRFRNPISRKKSLRQALQIACGVILREREVPDEVAWVKQDGGERSLSLLRYAEAGHTFYERRIQPPNLVLNVHYDQKGKTIYKALPLNIPAVTTNKLPTFSIEEHFSIQEKQLHGRATRSDQSADWHSFGYGNLYSKPSKQ